MRRAFDLSLYLVLDPVLCGGFDGMVSTAFTSVRAGATVVQLRAPGWKKRDLVNCARALKKTLAPFSIPLIIDDDADVCLAADADGLHVGQRDLEIHDARAVIGPDRILGLSVSNLEELAGVDAAVTDYLGVGPIFATSTKPDAAPAMGYDGLATVTSATSLPTVAIGGIKAAHAADIIRTGADGIAVVSAICGQADPAAATAKLKTLVDAALSERNAR